MISMFIPKATERYLDSFAREYGASSGRELIAALLLGIVTGKLVVPTEIIKMGQKWHDEGHWLRIDIEDYNDRNYNVDRYV